MSLGDVANPRVWLTGDCWVGPLGTAAPTDLVTALNVALLPLGLLTEDGLTEQRADTTNDYYAWGGILVRTVRSKFKRSFVVHALEDNKTVWALVNPGSTVSTATGITTRVVKTPTANPQMFVWQVNDGTAIGSRLVVPRGEVIAVADVARRDDQMTEYALTINVYPDSSGVLYREITNDPQAIVP